MEFQPYPCQVLCHVCTVLSNVCAVFRGGRASTDIAHNIHVIASGHWSETRASDVESLLALAVDFQSRSLNHQTKKQKNIGARTRQVQTQVLQLSTFCVPSPSLGFFSPSPRSYPNLHRRKNDVKTQTFRGLDTPSPTPSSPTKSPISLQSTSTPGADSCPSPGSATQTHTNRKPEINIQTFEALDTNTLNIGQGIFSRNRINIDINPKADGHARANRGASWLLALHDAKKRITIDFNPFSLQGQKMDENRF